MQWIDNIPVWGTPVDEGAMSQIRTCLLTAHKVALMGDHHKGYAVPIGGVVGYIDAISPSGVGFDIGCGNKAVRLDISGTELRKNIRVIMDDVWNNISFGVGLKNATRIDHPLFDEDHNGWRIPEVKALKELAHSQLGTIGSGNHYVDLFVDELDRAWVGVHFGSRGFGHKIATHFLTLAGASDGMDVAPCVISTKTTMGQDYLAAMGLAGKYAYAGRDWVCEKVASIIGTSVVEEIHNHHNFAWEEIHDGETMWVVRKGATPAFPDQLGFVGGSMGEESVIIRGIHHELSSAAMASTIHGAGRSMGRMEAKGKRDKATGGWKREPKVTKEMMQEWVTSAKIELRGAGVDESPHCYKRLNDVLDSHDGTIEVLHRLTPIGVAMAGANEFDPYKD